jgi:16S rRNA (cytosine967-C5)-methyltransferase
VLRIKRRFLFRELTGFGLPADHTNVAEKIMYPRSLAIRVLTRVLSEHSALDEALNEIAPEGGSATMGWLQDVCSGTLRWKGRLDSILDSISIKKKPSGWLRKILLVATYQLVVQDRAHAGVIVSETVSEVKAKEGEAPAKFANALLRKVAEHAGKWRNLPFPSDPLSLTAAAWASFPEWLWQKMVRQQGAEWAQAYALASLDRPKLWIRAKPEWSADWLKAGPIPGSWEATASGHVIERPGFVEGVFFVQDISSQLLISDVTDLIRKDLGSRPITALDICAAPGGKSAGLAWSGFQVTSTDRLEKRVYLLSQTVARVAPEIQVIPWDKWGECEPKDLIWVDAPCSGTGILRRHPDVRWLRQEKELPSLIQAQRELLRHAWEKVPVGGYLAYSVCSVLREEGPDAIEKTGLQKFVVQKWFLCPQTAPYGDGFWAALLKKAE